MILLTALFATLAVMARPDGDPRRHMALRAQSLRNLTPEGHDVSGEIRNIADTLGRGGRDAFYFSTLNILVDQLFSEGRFAEADNVVREMDREATAAKDRLARAISRRLRGQMLFKLSQPEMALHELDTALILAPHHELDLNSFSTQTSINEWRAIVSLQLKDTLKAIGAMRSYRTAVDYWRSAGWQDSTRHFEVTALAYEADEALWQGDRAKASQLLDKAKAYMLPHLPARAYEHWYYADIRLLTAEGRHAEALRDADILLATHRDFPWFYITDLRTKARILGEAGHNSESRELYERAAEMRDSLSAGQISRQLADLSSLYGSEIDRQQRIAANTQLFAVICVASLLFILVLFLSYSYMRQRQRNRLLVEKLHDYDRRVETAEKNEESEQASDCSDSGDSALMTMIEAYMRREKPFSDPSFGRKQLAAAMKSSVGTVARCIRESRCMTVHSLVNAFRLDESRHLLEDSEMTLAEIASAVGFGTTRTFQRIFKENYSMSPSQYRDISRKG